MMKAGEAPLWNPLRGAGQPLLANPNALVLHPTTLLFLALPFELAFKLSIILQVLLAGMGAWLVLRDVGACRSSGLLGAAVFAFSGYMLSLGNLLNLLGSAAFMPWTLWLAGRAVTRGFSPWGSLAALSLAVQLMAGEPAILLCTAGAFAGLHWSYAVDGGAGARARSLKARLGTLAGVGLLGISIAMVAVLPTTELLVRSERAAGFDRDEALKWSLPPVALLESAVPRLYGDPTSTDPSKYRGGGLFDAGLPLILSIYLGQATFILAGLGLASGLKAGGPRRAEAAAVAALAALGTLVAMGRFVPLYPALLSLLPPLESVRYPVKYFLAPTWAIAVLAARGYQHAVGRTIPRAFGGRAILLALGAGAGFGLLAWLGVLAIGSKAAIPSGQLGAMVLAAMAAAATTGCLFWPGGRAMRLGLLLIPLADLGMTVSSINPVAPASFYDEPSSTARLLSEAGGEGRVWAAPRPAGFAFRTPTAPHADSLIWGFRWDRMTLRNATYFPSGLRFAYDRGNERLDVMPGAAIARALAGAGSGQVRPEAISRLLSLAGVDRLITYGGIEAPGLAGAARLEGESNISVVVMKNAGALPRAWIAPRSEVIPDLGAALRRLDDPSFDPRQVALLEQPLSASTVAHALAAPADGPAPKVITETARHVVVSIPAGATGYLVLSDTFYPGWKARVDGQEAMIVRADAMFRAVALPAGAREVEFSYAPSSVRSGLMVTAASLLLAALLAVPRRR